MKNKNYKHPYEKTKRQQKKIREDVAMADKRVTRNSLKEGIKALSKDQALEVNLKVTVKNTGNYNGDENQLMEEERTVEIISEFPAEDNMPFKNNDVRYRYLGERAAKSKFQGKRYHITEMERNRALVSYKHCSNVYCKSCDVIHNTNEFGSRLKVVVGDSLIHRSNESVCGKYRTFPADPTHVDMCTGSGITVKEGNEMWMEFYGQVTVPMDVVAILGINDILRGHHLADITNDIQKFASDVINQGKKFHPEVDNTIIFARLPLCPKIMGPCPYFGYESENAKLNEDAKKLMGLNYYIDAWCRAEGRSYNPKLSTLGYKKVKMYFSKDNIYKTRTKIQKTSWRRKEVLGNDMVHLSAKKTYLLRKLAIKSLIIGDVERKRKEEKENKVEKAEMQRQDQLTDETRIVRMIEPEEQAPTIEVVECNDEEDVNANIDEDCILEDILLKGTQGWDNMNEEEILEQLGGLDII